MSATTRILSPHAAIQLVRRPKKHNARRDHYGVRWWDDIGGCFDFVTDHNSRRMVDAVAFDEFAANRTVEAVGPVLPRSARPAAIARLESFLAFGNGPPANDPRFNILVANCEHFARYVVTGAWYSEQVAPIEHSHFQSIVELGKQVFGASFVPIEPAHPLREPPLPGPS